ncbi:M50 family metallopeptidase [Legionella impletisoli]|uniref:Peptidase n=1 Tax=Legionella impletisoli TaxID=343510 RepID=A0A917JU24_9GAMM|nr:site-2 protease family protein [Legionella impletisoli]GGI86061.1 peptidase [Legionella impletisoli]
MSYIIGFLGVILSLILVIGLHEAGHALSARFFKVKIKRISIGFGKPIFLKRSKTGIEWVWARWPIGGYVKLLNTRIDPVSSELQPYCFDKKAIWKRVVILLSGALANALVALFALQGYYMIGHREITPVVAEVSIPSPAAKAGLGAGDRILSINGQPTPSWRAVGMQFIILLDEANVPILIQKPGGKTVQMHLDLNQWEYSQQRNDLLQGLGIKPALSKRHINNIPGVSFFKAFYQAVVEIGAILYFFLIMLKQLFTGTIPFATLLGPIGLFSEMVISFLHGIAVYLFFIANLSLAVGLVNLMPIPGLDGGSIVYALIEKIRGKPISVPLEILLHRLALIILVVAMIQLLMNDLQRYLQQL